MALFVPCVRHAFPSAVRHVARCLQSTSGCCGRAGTPAERPGADRPTGSPRHVARRRRRLRPAAPQLACAGLHRAGLGQKVLHRPGPLRADGMVAALRRRHRSVPRSWCSKPQNGEEFDLRDTIIGVDLAKCVFQLHGATTTGHVTFRKKLTREQFRRFMAERSSCLVGVDPVSRTP